MRYSEAKMRIEVILIPGESTRSEFASVKLECGSVGLSSSVDINFSMLLV